MSQPFSIRPAAPNELQALILFVARVTDRAYGDISPSLREALEDDAAGVVGEVDYWRDSVLALRAGELVGVGRVGGDRLDDLWIDAACHRQGLGKRLLRIAEQRIRDSGHRRANLHVVLQNTNAVHFYESNGWKRGETYPHARWGFTMLRLSKEISVT